LKLFLGFGSCLKWHLAFGFRVLRRNKGGFFGFCVLGFDDFASMVAGFRVLRINSLNLLFGSFGLMRFG
jgi:hypothetical protein